MYVYIYIFYPLHLQASAHQRSSFTAQVFLLVCRLQIGSVRNLAIGKFTAVWFGPHELRSLHRFTVRASYV